MAYTSGSHTSGSHTASAARASEEFQTSAADWPYFTATPLPDTVGALTVGTWSGNGGLYVSGGGTANSPSASYQAAIDTLAAAVIPRDTNGASDPSTGKIGLVLVGMSNVRLQAAELKRLADLGGSGKGAHVVIANAGQNGKTTDIWDDTPDDACWAQADSVVSAAGLGVNQVQVLYDKLSSQSDTEGASAIASIVASAKTVIGKAIARWPQLRLVYLTSSSYRGWNTAGGAIPLGPSRGIRNSEPFRWQCAVAVRTVCADRESGAWAPGGQSPAVLWAPYLWTRGGQPNAYDGWSLPAAYWDTDGVHPSNVDITSLNHAAVTKRGDTRTGQRMLTFFLTQAWFLR